MKFSDGYWLNKKCFDVRYAEQAYSCERIENGFRVTATPSRIYNRGQTLGGPNLTVDFFAAGPDIIGVRISHFKAPEKPSFELNCSALNTESFFIPEVDISEDKAVLKSGDTKVQVEIGGGWNVKFYYRDRLLTENGWRTTSYIREDANSVRLNSELAENDYPWSPKPGKGVYIRERLSLGVNEKIYGFGEKFTQFVKNGQSVDIWNADGGTCSDLSYKSVPFYMSSAGYGVFVNHPGHVSFEVATEVVNAVSFSVPGESLEYYVIGGEDMKAVAANYTELTGKPALPPAYTFGLWLTTSFTTNYDEETVTSFIDGMAERDIPLSVFHFDCFWMKEYHWCDFEWDRRQFPEPDQMLKRLKERGLHICVWINPYISMHSKLFDIGAENGYFIKTPSGGIYQNDEWQPGMAIVDFTNPAACEWYKENIRKLIREGVDCIKTDFGERIPSDGVYFDGSDPERMHNYYSYLYNKAVFEAIEEVSGAGSGCLFARSATAGGQKFPVHWGGDCSATYSSMAETIRGGLSLCTSGFGFFSHDISGFESTATPDIYKRWSAFGLLSTHSRLHGNSSYRVPWLFDEESCDVLRHFVKLKGRLMPYIFTEAVKTSRTGVPMVRPMVMEFPNDKNCLPIETQYMFGESLLVAPILNDRGTGEFYVPESGSDEFGGEWTDIQTGERFKPGSWYTRSYDYFTLPLLAKPGSIIAYGQFSGNFEYDYANGAEFVIYEPQDGQCGFASVCDTNGEIVFTLSYERQGGTVYVRGDSSENYEYTVRIEAAEPLEVNNIGAITE